MNELDNFVETILLPKYNRGETRSQNPEYSRLNAAVYSARKSGKVELYKALKTERNKLPAGDPFDPDYRRLKYVRYADDFLLGFAGPKSEADAIKEEIRVFLTSIKLEMSEEKTLITHATDDTARFLGYDISMAKDDSKKTDGKRVVNGQPVLRVPEEVVNRWAMKYWWNGKPFHRTELLNNSDYDIVRNYDWELRGIVNYYALAINVAKLYKVKYVFLFSLAKTLAVKHKQSITWVMRRYYRKAVKGERAAGMIVTVEREGQKPLVASFGTNLIRHRKSAIISDSKVGRLSGRTELVERLLADTCELCGKQGDTEVHHIKKLADLQKRYQGRKNPPLWVVRMIELRRKTLVVCLDCHKKIHAGRYDGERLKAGLLESRVH